MLENYNKYILLKVFLDNPTESFRLRELSRLSKISPPSVINYLREFEKQELIHKYEKRKVPYYEAKRDNEDFIFYKKLSILYELHKSRLIDYLWQELSPEAIILYGSHAKGEAIESSDIDIFIIGRERKVDIERFERKLGKNIHIMMDEIKNISKELKNNLINGIVLRGYFKVLR